jgi:hypothetical protein
MGHLQVFSDFLIETCNYVIKDEMDHQKICTYYTDFLVKKVRSGSDMAKKFQSDPQYWFQEVKKLAAGNCNTGSLFPVLRM